MNIDKTTDLIRAQTFAVPSSRPVRIGIEAEFIPIDSATHEVASIAGATLPALEAHAARYGWQEIETTKGAPRFAVPGGGCLTFEPGGQIEYATPPFESPSALLDHLDSTLRSLSESFRSSGVELLGAGIDPFTPANRATLQVDAERYRRMDAYYATLGIAGARMMRQTASIQINVDAGEDPVLTWRVLNALAPLLTAVFANSRRYAGVDTGHASYRSHTWQTLDASRTGMIAGDDDDAFRYARFALDATAMFAMTDTGEYRPFRDWVERGLATHEATATHLSTLFPEVRPRRYYEIRSIDALPLGMHAAPTLLVAGLVQDSRAMHEAAELLGSPDPALLATAACHGLLDPTLDRLATEVVHIALDGCRRMSTTCDASHIDQAGMYFELFTRQRRSPGDDPNGPLTVATAA